MLSVTPLPGGLETKRTGCAPEATHFLVSLPTQPRDSEQDLVFRLFELWKTPEVKASA